MSLIKITLASGETHEFPFAATSTLTVESTVSPEPTVTQRQQRSYSDVVKVKIVEGASALSPEQEADLPGLASAEQAVVFAKGLPLADAATHVERALGRFPDDPDLLQVWADLNAAAHAGAETWSTQVGETPAEEQAPAEAPPAVTVQTSPPAPPAAEEPADAAEPAAFESAEAALEHINGLATADEAFAATTAALEQWPEDEGLLAVKARLDEIFAERTQ